MFNRITIICSISFIVLYFITGFKFYNKPLVSLPDSKAGDERESTVKLHCPEPLRFEEYIMQGRGTDKDKKITEKNIDQDWYCKVIDNIKKDEYNISYSDELKSYQSPNRENNIKFIFYNDGFTAKTMQTKIPLYDVSDKTIMEKDKKFREVEEWSIKFKTLDVRCETRDENDKLRIANYLPYRQADELQKFNGSEIKVNGNTAYVEDDNVRINYTNNDEGMRQDFIIKNRPEGQGKLRLNLSADTKLKMIVGADALMFKDKNGEEKMKYSALKCWDANRKELRAYFEDNHELQIMNYELQKSKIENQRSKTNPKSEIPNPSQ